MRVLAMVEDRTVGGTGKAVLEFAREAALEGSSAPKVEISILTFSRGAGDNSLTQAVRDLRVPLDVVSERRRFDAGVISQLRAAVARRRPDLIWSNSVKSHFLVRWAGLNESCRWVAFHHGRTAVDVKMRVYNQLDRWSLRTADRVLTTCTPFVKELERNNVPAERIHVQHMAVRPFEPVSRERAARLRSLLGLDERTQVVLSVGRLSREKGHATLIRAFAKMQQLMEPVELHLVLVGEGPERPRLENLIRCLGLMRSVTLVGQQIDVNPYYGMANVFVLPSDTEGSPNVLLEAMSAGVPVVATDVGGVPEIVSNGREALLVPKGDTGGLASATALVLSYQGLRERLIYGAREVVARKSPAAYFQSIASVFKSALQ
ncbi:MAG TPA: glycosyltransferase [Candidatus Acidoferrales bacterium]|jgi:glycosyltransferase involved in cell wall biosynthesis